MKTILISILGLGLILITSCKNTEEVVEAGSKTPESFEQVVDTDSLLIAYQRGVCFGKCPQDKVIIYKSGYMVYEGKKDVDIVGKATNTLKAEDLENLKAVISKCTPEEYKEKMGMGASDLPSKTFTFNLGSKRKTTEIKAIENDEISDLYKSLNETIDQYFMY